MKALLETKWFKEQLHALSNQRSLFYEQLPLSSIALLSTLINDLSTTKLIITATHDQQVQLINDIQFFTKESAWEFPAWETLPSEEFNPSLDIVGQRLRVLSKLQTSNKPIIIITNLQACLQTVIDPNLFKQSQLNFVKDNSYNIEQVQQKLTQMGYQHTPTTREKGEFSVRGDIIDIFSVCEPEPIRLEFFGDDLESLRFFDPLSQKSIGATKQCSIAAADEFALHDASIKRSTILDYLPSQSLLFFNDLLNLEEKFVEMLSISRNFERSIKSPALWIKQALSFKHILFSDTSLDKLVSSYQAIGKASAYTQNIQFNMFSADLSTTRCFHSFNSLENFLKAPGDKVITDSLLTHENAHEYKWNMVTSTRLETNSLKEKASTLNLGETYHKGYLTTGFVLENPPIIYYPYHEIQRLPLPSGHKLRRYHHTDWDMRSELDEGDLVVHLNHGIGRYLGLQKKIDSTGNPQDFFSIAYANDSKVLIPVEQAHLITKYIGANEAKPILHEIGSKKWLRTRVQAEKSIAGYAQDLLEVYALRQMKGRPEYPEDSEDMILFEEAFPYTPTDDQYRAVTAIKDDFLSKQPMDRLICGDVGYGKTEVAMRAAFKAVCDGHKQVAVLVPTTLLALQHYENFSQRMHLFPLGIELLSRFTSSKKTTEIIEKIATHQVDIVIGTHKLLSEKINFANLGLLIIDEEQRFGVRAKEHLKKLKATIDCLALSATPIPRTLYMSLIGIRDLSVINTPPQDRLPIRTIIAEPNENLIQKAILRELQRDGQAFFIHNRVESIYEKASHLQKLVPQAKIVVAHGQMSSKEIDDAFHAFVHHKANLMVATSLIENGIDVPNANTIIIDRADRFGISDLYQMRGRVGRWNRQAYAYLLIPKNAAISPLAKERLEAFKTASGYGAGMKVALKDLETRGCGDLLGTQQSGQVAAIGFHLYCQLLKKTINKLKGKKKGIDLTDVSIQMDVPARIPAFYVMQDSMRLDFYQRIAETVDEKQLTELFDELKDRFGSFPDEVHWLKSFSMMRLKASILGYTSIKYKNGSIICYQSKKCFKENIGAILKPADLDKKITSKLSLWR